MNFSVLKKHVHRVMVIKGTVITVWVVREWSVVTEIFLATLVVLLENGDYSDVQPDFFYPRKQSPKWLLIAYFINQRIFTNFELVIIANLPNCHVILVFVVSN